VNERLAREVDQLKNDPRNRGDGREGFIWPGDVVIKTEKREEAH
jgi:hypothetical protein